MPPKNQPAAKKSQKKQGGDDDFDALLKQLAVATAAKGKEDAKDVEKHLTAAERKEAHRARIEKEAKAKEDAIAKSIEQRAQQKRLQDMIKEFIARGGGGMGQSPFLDEPKTDVECSSCVAKPPSTLVAGAAAMQGWRRAMEDAHIMLPNFRRGAKGSDDWHLFAVMDGHGGSIAANKTKLLLPPSLSRELEKANDVPSPAVFTAAFKAVDAALLKLGDEVVTCGCTCVTVLIGANSVHCASVGDSRAVLARKAGSAAEDFVSLSFDHKPENDEERKRIEAASGHVAQNRVNGNLAMSRALGDFTYKQTASKPQEEQQVICIPEVHSCPRLPDDEFVVIACDGIFDVFTNQAVVQEIRGELAKFKVAPGARYTTEQLEFAAANVTRKALAPSGEQGPTRAEGTDNMSIIIVQL